MKKWIDFKDWKKYMAWKNKMEPLALVPTYKLTADQLEEFKKVVDSLMKKWKKEYESNTRI